MLDSGTNTIQPKWLFSQRTLSAVHAFADSASVLLCGNCRIAERLVALLSFHHGVYTRARALCVVARLCAASGHCVVGGDAEVAEMVEAGLLPALLLLLHSDTHSEACVLRHSCRVLANICASSPEQLAEVFSVNTFSRLTPNGTRVAISVMPDYCSQVELSWWANVKGYH
jgi:hypothetical protein